MNDVFRTAPDTAPASPREVTPDIEADSAVHGRFLRLFGRIWTSIALGLSVLFTIGFFASGLDRALVWAGAPGATFALAGAALWAIGAWQRASALRVFREGIEVPGEVVDIHQDRHVRMNGRHPWRVAYEFMANGRPARGTATFWDEAPPRVSPGDRVAVLHAPGNPSRCVLWTRLDRGDPSPKLRIEDADRRMTAEEIDEVEVDEQRSRRVL